MALISLQNITVAFGGPRILDGVSLQLEEGERVALLGRNGEGKTTLMKVLSGELEISQGEMIVQKGIHVTLLPQEVPVDLKGGVFDIVLAGLGARAKLISDFHHISHRLHTEHSVELLRQLDVLQRDLDHSNGWEINAQVELILSQLNLEADADFEKLSGGQKRRVLLARAVVCNPNVLLLDEPTNHLDIESIEWLEGFLKNYSGTVFFVTHDRMFMSRLATRILEVDRGKLFSWACDYKTFLERKQMFLENEAAQRADFEKRLAQEEIWIRQGVKARRARSEGRVKALERMREVKKSQRKQSGLVKMNAQETGPSGHLVIKAASLGYSYDAQCLIRDFSTQIMRGEKIGVIGPNGSGKTTLLRILLGQLAPHKGKVRLGTNLEIAYYDQLREQLDEEKSVIENISGTSDTITINGKPRHIIGYMQDFLFSPERARTPVKVLSGGERNRLFLARLFTKPSNLLVMDEPTNDLDIETLELLEELLLDYSGTLLLVSHDRAFLNNVVTSTIVLEGKGEINEYPGGYDDWLVQRKPPRDVSPSLGNAANDANVPALALSNDGRDQEDIRHPRKLSFKEQRELETLPAKIEKLEAEQESIYTQMSEIAFFQKDAAEVSKTKIRLERIEEELLRAYERWGVLEEDS